jgi:amino acid transporter
MAEGRAGVFVREATGLVKNVSLLDAVSINVSDMSAGAALANIGFTTILLPTMMGVNLVWGSVIGFILVVPQLVIYTMMNRRITRTGGDYVWASRALGGFGGNVLAFIGYTLGNLPYASLIALSAVFAIGSVGVQLGNMSMLGLALPGNASGADVNSQFIIAAGLLVILLAINVLRPKVAFKMISVFTMFGIFSVLLAIGVLLSAGQSGVANYMGSLGNSTLTYQAVSSSYSGPQFDFANTLVFVPFFALFSYPWINAGPAVGSELRGKSAVKYNVIIAGLVVFALVTAGFATMYYVGGFNFINGALSNSNLVYNFSFNFWTLAMGVAGTGPISWIIGLGWILWIINILAYLFIVEARYLMAQAFDRFLPSRVTYVNKHGSPVVAHIIDFVIILAIIGGASFFYGTFVSLYGTIVGPMIYFAFIGVSAVIYAVRHERGSSKAVLAIAGALSALAFAFLVYEFLAYASVWGGTTLAYYYVVGAGVAGVVIYGLSKWYHAKRGIDISLSFKEIPPE